MIGKRDREGDLLLGGGAGGIEIRRAELVAQMPGQRLDGRRALVRPDRLGDGQRRETEAVDADEAGAESGALLAFELGRIAPPEQEAAGDRPFSGLGRAREDEAVRWIEPDGAQHFHSFGAPVSRSSQETAFSPARKPLRLTASVTIERVSRSPSPSRRRSSPGRSLASRAR